MRSILTWPFQPKNSCPFAEFPVRKFATEVVAPKVSEMDEKEQMDPEIIKALFDQGVRQFSISRSRSSPDTRPLTAHGD